MFITTHVEPISGGKSIKLAFVKSTDVQAFPCGRRRSTLIDNTYRIPFDPEARLNTEANNRKHSSLNGYTQTYLKDWDEDNKLLTLALAGYLFNITLPAEYLSDTDPEAEDYKSSEDKLGAAIDTTSEATKIYANILIEDTHLYSGSTGEGEDAKRLEYFTGVLRNQTDCSSAPEAALDLSYDDNVSKDEQDSYYFSGLSFSTEPLTVLAGDVSNLGTVHEKARTFTRNVATGSDEITTDIKQTFVSLCILEKVKTTAEGETPEVWEWKVHQPAYLPRIEHGATEDSIVVTGDALMKSDLTVGYKATIKEAEITDKTNIKGELVVKNDDPAKATFDNALVTGVLVVTNPELNPDNPNYDPEADPASIIADYAGIDDISAGTIEAEDIQQKIGNDHYAVPVIFLEPKAEGDKTFYQLQISRVNHKN